MEILDKMHQKLVNRKSDLQADYRAVFETVTGQKVLEHMAKEAHLFEPTFVPGDPYLSALREGEQRVVLSILKLLNTDLSKFQSMMENSNEL